MTSADGCWCLAYHFTDLDGREICEHACHEGELDADALVRRLYAARYELEQELAFREELQIVNAAGYLRGLRLPVTSIGPTTQGKSFWLARVLQVRRRGQ